MNISLSGNQILNALNGDTQIVTYKDIVKCDTLDDLFGDYDNAVILYLTDNNYGHWTCIFKKNNVVYFFDSYGTKPDGQFKNIPDYVNKQNHQTYKYLTDLLLHCPYEVRFNQYKLQKHGDGINTCGRWVIERLRNKDLDENEFAEIFIKSGCEPDELITLLTKNVVKFTRDQKTAGKIDKITKLEIVDNTDPQSNKRALAKFTLSNGKVKIVKFGLKNSLGTYFDGRPMKKRMAYLARHSGMGENWNLSGIMTPGWLSRWVLWEKRANETEQFLKNKTKIKNLTINIKEYD
jgi:hypothetical protein